MSSAKTDVSPEVQAAVAMLREGGVIAFPTDTLYALAADATNSTAVDRVFAIKGREPGKPLPLFVSGLPMAEAIAEITASARTLAAAFWPGALTIILRRRSSFESEALAGGDTVGLRAPDHPLALEIVAALGRPVTATSANLSGGADPVSAADVRAQLAGALDLIVDGGACPTATSSTIVDCTQDPPAILRQGALGPDEIARALLGPLA